MPRAPPVTTATFPSRPNFSIGVMQIPRLHEIFKTVAARGGWTVQAAEDSISVQVQCSVPSVGFDQRIFPNEHRDFTPILRRAGADGGGPGCSQTRAGMTAQELYRLLQDVGHDLHPDLTVRAAIGRKIPRCLVAYLMQHFDVVSHRVRVAF